ncbi:MAG: hypothetical protein GY753_06325, partial [Gammaproteobacteria bacterium]|nr:hypothetical protein [Gammaproteobacteria bacterium]
ASGSAGDFNNDGRPDLMVSAPGANDHLGAVYILYGGSSLNSTTGIVDAAKNNLPGIVLIGEESDERLGTSISAGVDSSGKALDVTGDGKGDIIVGASNVNAVYIYTDANDPSSRLELIYGGPNSGSNPALPLGADVALIPSIDGDPYADILVGTQGMVSVIYGGPDFLGHTRDYTSSWKQSVKDKDGSTHTWQVVLSFGGKDIDKDGILRGRGSNPSQIEGNKPNEINAWMMRVYRDDVQVANYAMNNQNHRSDFNFNFDLDKQRVLASDDIHDENGLNVGFLATKEHNYNMQSDTTCITLTGWVDGAAEVVAASQAGDQMFDCISNPGSFDLATLDDVPGMGMILNSYIAQPMSVAGAGDINNDGYADIVIGYGETSDPDTGDPISGGSFLLYGSASDTVGGTIQLEDIENYNQGIIFKQAGGTVQAAGDFNGDGIDDLVIGAPAGVGTNTRAYVLCGKKNGNPTVGLQLSSIDTLALTGAAVAPAGDLNGDGKTDLLIGAPYMADPKVVSNLQTEMQIQYAALPLVPGSGEAKDFNLTQSAGIGPMLIGSTGSGSLLTWVEVGMDSTFTLYGSFWKGTAWGTRMEIRNSPNDISHVSISDIYNTKSGSASVPTVVWQETDNDRGNQPSLWQGVYNITSGWSKSPFQPVQSKSAPGQTTNDESSLVVDGSEYNVEDVTATEADGYAIFEVIRSGNTSYAHTLHYRTVDISASAGLDYGHSEGKLNFAKGETSKTIKIPIHQDNDKEHRGERVLLVLKSRHPRSYYLRNGLRRSGTPRMTAELLISDDDDKVLELTAINSGFIVAGDTAVSFGGAVSSAGDINKDGYADFLVGASGVSDHKGVVYLVYGKKGIELKDMDLYLSEASADDSVVVLSAITDSIIAGSSVASGSGYIAIGAPGNASTPGKVYVVTADMLKGKTSLVLESDAIVLHTTANTPGNRFGATLTFGNVDNTGGDDLVIVAPGPNGSENPGQVYVVYDSFLQTTQAGSSYIIDGTKSNIDVITNSAGTGFGLAAAVGDFDYDNNNDLILGSTHGETLYDQLGGGVRGYGGQVFAIWGKKSGQHGSIDVGTADSIATFSGQAEFSQPKSSPSIDPGTGASQDNPAPNFALTDGIGDVVVLLDLDGNGCQDLAIGAPSAFIARPDGSYDVANILSGRIYVLFGSSDWKRKNTYDLINLYGDDYKMGIVLEGKLAKSLTGASLANAGFVRGTADSIAGIEDLLIGAPSTNADAGQAYLVFGSANRYTKNVTQAGENILKLDSYTDPANTKVALLFAYQGITNPLSSDNSRNSGKVGQSVAGAGDINGDGADDILIGAPTSSVKGLGQTYIPIGHPWIMPGQHLNVKDLRSDNGFVLQVPGPPAPVGDVNGDGYDDVVMLGESPELVLGATPMANVNGVRQFQLLPRSVISDNTIVQAKATWTYHISTSGGHTWTVYASFTGVDRDNDGILRGRVDQSQIDGGYYNELTDWTFEYWESYAYFQNNALKCCKTDLRVSYDWLQQQANTGFNFNYDIAANKVINSGKGISDANGCYLGLRTDYYIKAGSDKYFRFYHSGNSQEIGGNASFPGTPIPNTPVVYSNDGYQLTWNGEGDYKVVIDFGGMDLDGDGILRGRGTDPASVAQGSGDNIFGNELTSFLMRVYHGSALSFTYQLEEQQQRSDFNFNYDLIRHEVVAEDEWNTGQGINLGIWNIVGAYDFSSWVSDADIKLQLINDAQGKDREDVASTGFGSQYFHLTRQPTVPGAQEKIRYAGWKPASGWTVDLYFTGSDRNGDGYIRGRGKSNPVGGLANELTQFTMIVAQNGVTKATYYLSDLLNLNGSNFNFWVLDKAVRASGQEGDVNHGIKIGVPSGDGYVINSNTGDLSNANIILKQIKGGKYTVVGSTGRGDNRFTISSSPLGVVGPLVAGDFNGDSYEDFILFTNLGTLRTAALETNGAESRPAYIYYGNTDATFTVSRPDTLAVPLSYISGAKTGDINGDGYQDLVISGYNYNISDAATAPDKSYLLAYYGGSDPFDLSIPDTILYTETGNISRHVLAVLDINNNGQDDIVTYTLKRVHAEIPPLPYLVTGNVVTNKIENLYILGADSVGGTPSWQEPITLSGSTFADGSLKTDMLLGLVPGRQADVNNDGKIDLIFTAQNVDPSTYGVGLKSDGYVLLSSGSFTFQDGSGKLNTVEISYKNLNKYSGTNVSVVLPNPEAAPYQSRITGIGDFNLDGIDDIFVMPDLRDNVRIQPYSYVIHGNDKFGYNEKSSYTSYSLEDADKDFSMGTAIEGLQGILEPYTASDAGDLNGDGFGDIMMADVTNALSYGIYGYRADSLSNVEYITGSDDDDVLQQFSSTKTTVNISGKGGDDFIQTLRTVKGLTTPYSLVLNGGPGDDQIGISTTIPKDIIRIDGGPGFDQLFINPYYAGNRTRLDLTDMAKHIRNIELIDLAANNSIEFGFVEVRNLSETSNTLLLRGTNSAAIVQDGNNWKYLGQSTHDGVVYNVHEYLPVGNSESDIQVWVEYSDDPINNPKVNWNPVD